MAGRPGVAHHDVKPGNIMLRLHMVKITAMRCFFGAGLLALATATAGAPDRGNSLSPNETKEGWMLLFDGRTLAGWEARSTSSPSSNGDWTIKDGAMVCPGSSA